MHISRLGLVAALSLICLTEAEAANRLPASFTWSPSQLSEIQFSPPNYRQGKIGLSFSDPRKGNEIEKILFDPTFKPKRQMPDGSSVSDFFLDTIIRSPVSGAKIKETALCDWDNLKSVATCVIEDDGGRFQIEATPQSGKLKLTFVVRSLAGFSGFRIAQDGKPGQEPKAIDVKLKNPSSVIKSPIKF